MSFSRKTNSGHNVILSKVGVHDEHVWAEFPIFSLHENLYDLYFMLRKAYRKPLSIETVNENSLIDT